MTIPTISTVVIADFLDLKTMSELDLINCSPDPFYQRQRVELILGYRQRHEALLQSQACLTDVVLPKEYDTYMYSICKGFENQQKTFLDLRRQLNEEWRAKAPKSETPFGFTALFDGVYIGDHEDVVYVRLKGSCSEPQYPIRGLGLKVASIKLL